MLRYFGLQQSEPQKIISDFQSIITSGEEQRGPRIPKFIKTLNICYDNCTFSQRREHQKKIQCIIQSMMDFVTQKFLKKANDNKKRSSSLLAKVSNSLSKLKFSYGKLTAEKVLIIMMIIHCLLQQMRQQISSQIKDSLIYFLKCFRKFVEDYLEETNQQKLEKLDQSFKSTSNSSRFEFRNKISNDSSVKKHEFKRSGSNKFLPNELNKKLQFNKTNPNECINLKNSANIQDISIWDGEGSRPQLSIYTDQQSEPVTSRGSQNTTKELYLLKNVINPYMTYLHKLIALSQYYQLIKLRNGTNFSTAEVWIPINLLKTLTEVTICFPTIGRYYMTQYGQHVVLMSQLFCMDVLWTYLKIFNLIDTNVRDVEDQVKKITKNQLTKKQQDKSRQLVSSRKSNSILYQIRKKAAEDQITSFDLEQLDQNFKSLLDQEIMKNSKLIQNVNELYKVLEEINIINDKLMILFFCKYFRPKINYIKFPKLIENSRRDYPLVYEIHKLQKNQNNSAIKNYKEIQEFNIKPESLIVNKGKVNPNAIFKKQNNVPDPYKKIRNIMKPKNQVQNSSNRVNLHLPTRQIKKNNKLISFQDRTFNNK